MKGTWLTRPLKAVLLAFVIFFLPASAGQAEKRVALVIGNSAYQNAPPLATPVKDAKAMADMLHKAGFNVAGAAYDAGNGSFRKAIRQFDDAAADSDVAVVYFAGHGVAVNGINYLVPVDARLLSDWDAEDELVPLDRFIAAVAQAKRLAVVILDASADNPLTESMKRERPTVLRGFSSGSAPVDAANLNVLIAYAAKEGSATVADSGDHSPYTAALLQNLFVPGLDVRLALGRVRDDVLKATDNHQEPVVYGELGGGSIALVPGSPASAPSEEAIAARTDYRLIAKINTKGAWEVFLNQYPTGCYADLARGHIAALDAAGKDAPAVAEKISAATPCDK